MLLPSEMYRELPDVTQQYGGRFEELPELAPVNDSPRKSAALSHSARVVTGPAASASHVPFVSST